MGNVELLKKVRDQIVMFPETHNQNTWACGTAMCIAGHASVLAGGKIWHDNDGGVVGIDNGDNISSIPSFADEMLGLSDEEHSYLFYCWDNATAVKRVDQIIGLWENGEILEDIAWEDRIHED